jgi:hypothetical protein
MDHLHLEILMEMHMGSFMSNFLKKLKAHGWQLSLKEQVTWISLRNGPRCKFRIADI